MVKRKIFEEKRKMSELSIQPLTKFKLVFLGEQAVGKTSLITRLNLLSIARRFGRTLSGFKITISALHRNFNMPIFEKNFR